MAGLLVASLFVMLLMFRYIRYIRSNYSKSTSYFFKTNNQYIEFYENNKLIYKGTLDDAPQYVMERWKKFRKMTIKVENVHKKMRETFDKIDDVFDDVDDIFDDTDEMKT